MEIKTYKPVMNNKLVLKNTFILYTRQILILFVGLYTSREILRILGAIDFGIYNLVAGAATMLGFLSSAMTTACQRYFSFQIGRDNKEKLAEYFQVSLVIYVIISLVNVIVLELLGVWLIEEKLIIPLQRISAAKITFHLSLVSFIITILGTPFKALIVSYEKINVYLVLSIIECFFKLGMIFVLKVIPIDLLAGYAFLLLLLNLITTLVFAIFCKKNFSSCIIKLKIKKDLFFEMLKYVTFNLFGNIAGVSCNQGISIVLNLFFGPTINTARAIANQINGAVITFAGHFSSALSPQLVKNFAVHDYTNMRKQLYTGIKITFFLMFVFSLPLIMEMKFILNLWLGEYPDHTILFSQLVLAAVCMDIISYPIDTLAQATGRIKAYQIITSLIVLLNIPLAIFFLKLFGIPEIVVYINMALIAVTNIVKFYLLHILLKEYLIGLFIKKVVLPIFLFVLATIPLPFFISLHTINRGVIKSIGVMALCVLSSMLFGYFILFNGKEERAGLKRLITKKG